MNASQPVTEPMHPSNPLVYLKVTPGLQGAVLQENDLISALKLQNAFDNTRLLIALGEISNSPRPLTPLRFTRLGALLILWLSEREWLVLPASRYGSDLEQALIDTFAQEIFLELIPDGSFEAALTPAALAQIADARHHQLPCGTPTTAVSTEASASLCIRPWTSQSAYHLLLQRADRLLLDDWLAALEDAQP